MDATPLLHCGQNFKKRFCGIRNFSWLDLSRHFQHIHVFCVCIKRKNRDPRENEKLRKCKISYGQLTFYRETDCDKLSAIRLNFAEAVSLYFYLKIHSSQCIFFNYSNYRKKHIGSFFEFMYKCTSSRNADCNISKICPMGR